jgi:hypothetical protein
MPVQLDTSFPGEEQAADHGQDDEEDARPGVRSCRHWHPARGV